MRKLLSILALCAASVALHAQSCVPSATNTCTPNIKLSMPDFQSQGWDVPENNNELLLDSLLSGATLLTSLKVGDLLPKQIDKCAVFVDGANSPGWAGSEGGAWINAADAALTASCGSSLPGMIYVHGTVAATTQITVGVRHTLDIQGGAITIANPILMSDGANIDCHHLRGSGGGSTVNACIVATAGMSSMIRGLTQDGTTEMFTLQRFALDGGFQTFTTGIIDTTGMNDRTTVQDGEIIHWNGAVPALYTANAPTNSTSFQTFRNIWINAEGSVGQTTQSCISIVTQGSNTGSIIELNYEHIECTGNNPTRAVLVQNSTSAANNAISNVHFLDLSFQLGTGGATTSGIYIDKAWNVTLEHTVCMNGVITNCIDVSSNANNVGEYAHNTEWGLGGSITNLINDGLNSISLAVSGGRVAVENYFFFNSGSTQASTFYDHTEQIAGTIGSIGTGPTLSGTGACATITSQAGGAFAGSAKCTGTTGASTLTITFATTQANGYVCDVWDETTRANVFQQTSHTATTCVLTVTSVTANDVFVFKAIGF